MCPIVETWRRDAAIAYLEGLHTIGLNLEVIDGNLRIPAGHTRGEVELVRLLKPELLLLLAEKHLGLPDGQM